VKLYLALCATAVLLGCTAAPPSSAPLQQRSGFSDMGAAVQAMQRDEEANPAMLWVQEGRELWVKAPSAQSKACFACHGDVAGLRGVAARYPAWDEPLRRPVNLGTRINVCRQRHQGLTPWPAEHQQLLALEALVGLQSRGLPIAPAFDRPLEPFRERGAALFQQRIGQLDMSCATCHDKLVGGKLAGIQIPQGQATGYPLYRLEWQTMGSLGRRIRNCMTGVRAEPLAANSVEMVQIELHLATRAMGMPVETPAVRP
jgi:sulfur-oxidizing protein SoxA